MRKKLILLVVIAIMLGFFSAKFLYHNYEVKIKEPIYNSYL